MPYEPKFTITAHLLRMTEEIAAFRERILAAAVQVTWIPTLRKDARVRNAHSSTAIEGNPLTLEQVRALEEGRPLPAVTERSRREVLNSFAGLRFVEKHQSKKVISTEDVLRLHRIISSGAMDQRRAGRLRDIRVHVGGYHPPPPGEIPEMIDGYGNRRVAVFDRDRPFLRQ